MSYPFTTAYLQLPQIPNTPFPSQLYVFLSYNSLSWVSATHACKVCALGPEPPSEGRVVHLSVPSTVNNSSDRSGPGGGGFP